MRDMKYWRQIMEAAPEEEDSEPVADESLEDVEPLQEVVYPFTLTEQMLRLYEDPAHNRSYGVDIYREILLKLLRSVSYWRLDVPRWLTTRLRALRAL